MRARILVVAVFLALLSAITHPAVFGDPVVGDALGIGELTLIDSTYRSFDPADPIDPSAIEAGETITIRFRTQGCFHEDDRLLRLVPDADGSTRVRSGRGTLLLTPGETVRLERLLRFYRSPREAGCTTQDVVQVELYRQGRRRAYEMYVDSSCDAERLSDALTLPALIDRLEPTDGSDPPV